MMSKVQVATLGSNIHILSAVVVRHGFPALQVLRKKTITMCKVADGREQAACAYSFQSLQAKRKYVGIETFVKQIRTSPGT